MDTHTASAANTVSYLLQMAHLVEVQAVTLKRGRAKTDNIVLRLLSLSRNLEAMSRRSQTGEFLSPPVASGDTSSISKKVAHGMWLPSENTEPGQP